MNKKNSSATVPRSFVKPSHVRWIFLPSGKRGVRRVPEAPVLAHKSVLARKHTNGDDSLIEADIVPRKIKVPLHRELAHGHLFASIHPDAIALALKKQKAIDLLPEHLVLDAPIKEVGEHRISVKAQGRTGGFTLAVKATAC